MLAPCLDWLQRCRDSNDSTPPTVDLVMPATHDGVTPFVATITWSEDVTGFTVGDVIVTGPATLSLFAGGPTVWTVTVTPTGNTDITLDIPAGAAADLAGNLNVVGDSEVATFVADVTQPTVVISGPPSHDGVTPFAAVYTFSEQVTGFVLGDLGVTLGTAISLDTGPVIYNAMIQPDFNFPVTLNVAGGVAQDLSGNNNLAAAPLAIPFVADVTQPTVLITSNPTHNGINTFIATITFSEPVTGFVIGDIVAVNGSLANFLGNNAVYTVEVTPTADADITIDVPAGVAQDLSGNLNLAAPQQIVTYVDTTPPTVVVTGPPSHDGVTPFGVTYTFSEPVTGFVGGEAVIGNGTESAFAGGPTVYTATITPGIGVVSVLVTVPGNVAQDAAGNDNITSGTLNIPFA